MSTETQPVAGCEPPAAPDRGAGRATPCFHAGNLTYNRRQLAWLFFWLLLGDVGFMIVSQFEPIVLPVLLKQAGAADHHVAWILGTIVWGTQLVLNPIYSYNSDRTRTRWGRRIPYLLAVTPLVSVVLALTPYAPEIAGWLQHQSWAAGVVHRLPWPPAVFVYGCFVFALYLFYSATNSIFFYLFRDVVPESHMGRFVALLRIASALGTFVLNYWLFGLGVRLPRPVFLAMALLNFAGFMAVCLFVREPVYPPVVARPRTEPRLRSALRTVGSYFRECFSEPLHWWTYVCRLMVYAAMTVMLSFVIFFPLHELGMAPETAGRALSWASLGWVVIAYPLGLLIDRWKVFRVMRWLLWIQSTSYLLSFFLIQGSTSFLVFAIITGMLFWAMMLCQFILGQEVFPALYLGQYFSANVVLQSIVIAAVVSPFCGWLFDALHGTTQVLTFGTLGSVSIGPYRYVMLILSTIYFVSLLGLYRVEALRGAARTRPAGAPAG